MFYARTSQQSILARWLRDKLCVLPESKFASYQVFLNVTCCLALYVLVKLDIAVIALCGEPLYLHLDAS